MQSPPANPTRPCPVCGAEASYRVWSEGTGYGYVAIRSKKHKISGSMAQPLACTVCGYMPFFVDPEDFRDLGQ